MKRQAKISLLAIALAATGVTAFAASQHMENDAASIAQAKVSLAQATTTAEQHVGGKASRAEFEGSAQGMTYDVEVVNGTKVYDVKVDADKGTVLFSTLDKADHDDNQDPQD